MNKKAARTKTVSTQKESQGGSLQDVRSPLAKARDAWLESTEGQSCTGTNILRSPAQRQFLENRLVSAFLAGATYQERVQNNKFTQGYVCAVAALVSGHGGGTIARDVLGCNTPDDWNIIDDYDRDILAKVGLAPRRRKSREATSVGRAARSDHGSVKPKNPLIPPKSAITFSTNQWQI